MPKGNHRPHDPRVTGCICHWWLLLSPAEAHKAQPCCVSASCFFILSANPLEFELAGAWFSFIINRILTGTISNKLWPQKSGLPLLQFHKLPCKVSSDIPWFQFFFNCFAFGSTYSKGAIWTPPVSWVQAFLGLFLIRGPQVAILTNIELTLRPSVSWPNVCSLDVYIKGGDRQQACTL